MGMVLFFVSLARVVDSIDTLDTLGVYSGFAILLLGVAQVVFLINLGYSAWWGRKSI